MDSSELPEDGSAKSPEPVNDPPRRLTAAEIRDLILSADDIRIVEVPAPEWGGHIYVRTMSYHQSRQYLEAVRPHVKAAEAQGAAPNGLTREAGILLATWTMCDATGVLLFSDYDIAELAKKSWSTLKRVIDAAAVLNEMS